MRWTSSSTTSCTLLQQDGEWIVGRLMKKRKRKRKRKRKSKGESKGGLRMERMTSGRVNMMRVVMFRKKEKIGEPKGMRSESESEGESE